MAFYLGIVPLDSQMHSAPSDACIFKLLGNVFPAVSERALNVHDRGTKQIIDTLEARRRDIVVRYVDESEFEQMHAPCLQVATRFGNTEWNFVFGNRTPYPHRDRFHVRPMGVRYLRGLKRKMFSPYFNRPRRYADELELTLETRRCPSYD